MERKLGEIFTYEGKTYQVIENTLCKNCAFTGKKCGSLLLVTGECSTKRSDKTSVAFKEINNMEIKNDQLTIEIPEGMEIDIENSNLAKGIVKFKKKGITYVDVEDSLNLVGNLTAVAADVNNVPKLSAINKLMNIARYYNKDWEPNWDSFASKFSISFNHTSRKYIVDSSDSRISGNVLFERPEDAQAVIDNPNFRDILDAIYKD